MSIDKLLISLLLLAGALLHPVPVPEHEDIGSFHLLAMIAGGQVTAAHLFVVDVRLEDVAVDKLAVSALQVVDAAVALVYLLLDESCFLEVTVDVGSHHEQVVTLVLLFIDVAGDRFEDVEAPVRLFLSVHSQPRPIEPPEEVRMLDEESGISAVVEIELVAVGRIMIPEAILSAEVWQSGVSSHACSSAHHHHLTLLQKTNCLLDHSLPRDTRFYQCDITGRRNNYLECLCNILIGYNLIEQVCIKVAAVFRSESQGCPAASCEAPGGSCLPDRRSRTLRSWSGGQVDGDCHILLALFCSGWVVLRL